MHSTLQTETPTDLGMVVEPETESTTGVCDRTCSISDLTNEYSTAWDAYVQSHELGTVFHLLGWRNAVRDAFHHRECYLVAKRNERIVGVLPMFLVKSRIAGRMLVSLPYAVGGGILADDQSIADALYREAVERALDDRCRCIDLRSERASVSELPIRLKYVGFRRELPHSVEDVLPSLPRKARAAARNARNKFRLRVDFGDEHLREVWEMYTVSMRRLGSLAYPFAFFEGLVDATPDGHWVSIVRRNGKPVAGLVTFLFRDRVMPYFVGTTDEATQCSAANYVYLTAMEHGVAEGYRVFDFGRSREDNAGSYDFKRFQGFQPRPLEYQMFTASRCEEPNLSPNNRRFQIARSLWKHLPLVITRSLGARIARHIPG